MGLQPYPDEMPRWATDGGAAIQEPSEAKKDVGWTAEKPPHEVENWKAKKTYDWLTFLKNQHADFEFQSAQQMKYSEVPNEGQVFDAAYSPTLKMWVAVGYLATSATMIISSRSGFHWTQETPADPNVDLRTIVWADTLGLFVAAGYDVVGAKNYICTSPDGSTWTKRSAALTYTAGFSDIGWNGSELIVVGNWEVITRSTDGINWTEIQFNNQNSMIQITWSEKLQKWFTAGFRTAQPDAIAESADGTSWAYVNTGLTLATSGIVWHPELELLATTGSGSGPNRTETAYSPDGVTWTKNADQQDPDTGSVAMGRVTATDHLLIAGGENSGNNSHVWISRDAVNWLHVKCEGWIDPSAIVGSLVSGNERVKFNGNQFLTCGSTLPSPGPYCLLASENFPQ